MSTQGHKNSSIYLTLFIVVRAINCSIWEAVGFPGGTIGKEPTCQYRRHKRPSRGFDPWVGKIPWRRAWQPTLVFVPGESHEQRSLFGFSS